MRLLATLVFVLVPLCAQPPEGAKKGGGGAPQPPKNLKVLKVEGPALIAVMRSYTTGLGVRCDHCHAGRDFASDENPKKNVARMMISMVDEINAKFPGEAKARVTCYTCHRGEVEPKTAPAPAAPAPGGE